jgi:hypothetical protein
MRPNDQHQRRGSSALALLLGLQSECRVAAATALLAPGFVIAMSWSGA